MPVTPESLTPATARKAVVFCCDANCQPYALFAAAQIAPLHPMRDLDICVCDTEGHYPPRFSRASAEFTAAHFPTHPPIVAGKGRAPDSGKMRRMTVKHPLSSRAMTRYLVQFPESLTVRP